MNTKLVFFLVGARRRIGKDTFAGFLYDAIRRADKIPLALSFAGALKDELNVALRLTGWPDSLDAWTQDAEAKEEVIRPLLIAWGNGRRYFNPNHWVDKVMDKALASLYLLNRDPFVFCVVSDWRFPNEILRLRDAAETGGHHVVGIHLSRRAAPEGTPDEIINDPLCQELADIKIANNGGLDALRETAELIVSNFIFQHDNPKTP